MEYEQFPIGFGSVMKTSISGSLDASGTVLRRLPSSRVNCCWRADKAIGVGSYAQQQDNYSTYEGGRMTTKTIKLYIPDLDCEIDAVAHYFEPQWAGEHPCFASVSIEKQEVTITDGFQHEQLRKLI